MSQLETKLTFHGTVADVNKHKKCYKISKLPRRKFRIVNYVYCEQMFMKLNILFNS
jgi:Flp pilus assembly CpaF family ATPase